MGSEAQLEVPVPMRQGLLDDGSAPFRRNVLVLAWNFFGVFAGSQAAQMLQTSLNARLGFLNLASFYSGFTLLSLAAAPLTLLLDKTTGIRFALFASSAAYVAMVFSNVSVANWALPIAMNVLAGLAAPILWASQNHYLGRCALRASQGEQRMLAARTAEFNGAFYSIYQLAGLVGNVLASLLLLCESSAALLFCVLGAISSAGALSFACLPCVEGEGEETNASATDTLLLAAKDARMGLFVPLIFTNGMSLSFFLGDYTSSVVSPVAGPGVIGFVAATFYGVNAAATAAWGRIIVRNVLSRRSVYLLSSLCIIGFFAAAMLWRFPVNFVKEGEAWHQVAEPKAFDVAALFVLMSVFAVGDAFLESGPVASLQNYFLGTRYAVPAMANTKLWQSLGYALQFALGAGEVGSAALRAGILAGCCALSCLALMLLDRRAPLF